MSQKLSTLVDIKRGQLLKLAFFSLEGASDVLHIYKISILWV